MPVRDGPDSYIIGKASSDSSEALKNKVRNLETENKTLKDKIESMEHRLAVVPPLEKEKLHLQKQVNKILQENEKRKNEVELVSTTVEKEKHEREELHSKNQTLSTDLEKSYEEIKELKQKKPFA